MLEGEDKNTSKPIWISIFSIRWGKWFFPCWNLFICLSYVQQLDLNGLLRRSFYLRDCFFSFFERTSLNHRFHKCLSPLMPVSCITQSMLYVLRNAATQNKIFPVTWWNQLLHLLHWNGCKIFWILWNLYSNSVLWVILTKVVLHSSGCCVTRGRRSSWSGWVPESVTCDECHGPVSSALCGGKWMQGTSGRSKA